MYDETTQAALKNNKGIEAKINTGFTLRQNAKFMEAEAKDIKAAADIILDEVFDVLEVEKIKAEGIGQVARRETTRVNYNIDEVKKYLIGHGVSATVVKNAVEAGKKESVSRYIEFRAAKK